MDPGIKGSCECRQCPYEKGESMQSKREGGQEGVEGTKRKGKKGELSEDKRKLEVKRVRLCVKTEIKDNV